MKKKQNKKINIIRRQKGKMIQTHKRYLNLWTSERCNCNFKYIKTTKTSKRMKHLDINIMVKRKSTYKMRYNEKRIIYVTSEMDSHILTPKRP